MSRVRRALGLLVAFATGAALAQSAGGEFAVKKSVIAGGSATAAGGSFDSSATLGQADAGQMSGGGFTVQGGFWPESASTTPPSGDEIFQDGFEGD